MWSNSFWQKKKKQRNIVIGNKMIVCSLNVLNTCFHLQIIVVICLFFSVSLKNETDDIENWMEDGKWAHSKWYSHLLLLLLLLINWNLFSVNLPFILQFHWENNVTGDNFFLTSLLVKCSYSAPSEAMKQLKGAQAH